MTTTRKPGRPSRDTATTLGALLRRLRGSKSCPEVAALVGVSSSTWQDWEAGASVPGVKSVGAVSATLGVSVSEIIDAIQAG